MAHEETYLANGNDYDDDDEESIDFKDLEEQYSVPIEDGFDNMIVADGTPVVTEEKKEKLMTLLKRVFGRAGTIKDNGMFMPMKLDEKTGKSTSQGVVFIEFDTPEQAAQAIKLCDGWEPDKKHVVHVNKFTDIEKYTSIPDEYMEPKEEELVENEHLRSWLKDDDSRDQFATLRAEELVVWWNQKNQPPEPAKSKTNWTESIISWSTFGTYLATFHRQGLQIWGGQSWNRINRFPHPNVRLVDFSPLETYCVTWSHEPINLPPPDHPMRPIFARSEGHTACVWEVRTGELLRTFPPLPDPESERDPNVRQTIQWPMFKWSADERYFARLQSGKQISVYEVPEMGLLEKTPIKIPGVVDFEWAPAKPGPGGKELLKPSKEQTLCYWTPEINNQPAKVTLMSIPSKNIIRTKALFNVSDCKLHWQSNGEFLSVKVNRHTKTKKTIHTNLEIFHVRDKNIPVDTIELSSIVISFEWEPEGERFIIITTPDLPNAERGHQSLKTNVSFYMLDKTKGATGGNFKLIRTLDRGSVDSIFPSPKGRFVAFANLVPGNTTFEFEIYDMDYDGENKDINKELNANIYRIYGGDAFGTTDVQWDPSGRYITTFSSRWKIHIENGYQIRDWKGQILYEVHLDKFSIFVWRPRPPTLLTKDDQRGVRRNMKEYSRTFEDEDQRKTEEVDIKLVEYRRALLREWFSWRETVERDLADEKRAYGLAKGQESEEEEETKTIEELVEEVIEEIEEVVD